MCLPPQFGLEPQVVQQTIPRQTKLQPHHVQQVQQQQQPVQQPIQEVVYCKPDPLQYQSMAPQAFDFATFDPLNAFDFNTDFILPETDDLFNFSTSTSNATCDDVVLPSWPSMNTNLEDLIAPAINTDAPTPLFGADDLSSFFSDSSSNKSFAPLSPSYSSSDSDVKPGVMSNSNANNTNGKKRKARKRRLACDLNPTELARTREVNRIAAQRHRKLLKTKRSEQESKYAELCRKNSELRDTLRTLTAESRALTRIVVDIFAPKVAGVSDPQSWANATAQMNAYSFPMSQQQVFC